MHFMHRNYDMTIFLPSMANDHNIDSEYPPMTSCPKKIILLLSVCYFEVFFVYAHKMGVSLCAGS